MSAKVPPIHPETGRTVVAVWFKDEGYDEPTDQPIGPVGFIYEDSDPSGARPFDPNRKPDPWVGRENAVALAEKYVVEFRET